MKSARFAVLHALAILSLATLTFAGCGQSPQQQSSDIPQTQDSAPVEYILHVLPLFNYIGGNEGFDPVPVLSGDPAVALYGATTHGGQFGYGTVYKLTPISGGSENYSETVLHSFNLSDGAYPFGGLAPLTITQGGTLYGTTEYGGTYNQGTVFQITTDGTFTTLYSFKGGSDGALPASLLHIDSAGNLFGTTIQGGVAGCGAHACCPNRCGTVYELSPSNGGYTEKIVYAFKWGTDGWYPWGAVTPVGSSFYGATFYGGNSDCPGNPGLPPGGQGCGTIYRLDPGPNGYVETVVHTFQQDANGNRPHSRMLYSHGIFYGTTLFGGVSSCYNGCGTVFSFDPSSSTYTVLHQFQGGSDGYQPRGGLTLHNGTLYGTTLFGGSTDICEGQVGCGVIFSITQQGESYNPFYCVPRPSNGVNPQTAVFEQPFTNQLYGTSVAGGQNNYGMVFKLQ